jgi:hypothetical protein
VFRALKRNLLKFVQDRFRDIVVLVLCWYIATMDLVKTIIFVHAFLFVASFILFLVRLRKYGRFDKAPFWFSLLVPLLGPVLTLIILLNDEFSGAGSARYMGQNFEEGTPSNRALQMFLK